MHTKISYNKYPVHYFWTKEMFMEDRWMEKLGIKNPWGERKVTKTYNELMESEWNHEFISKTEIPDNIQVLMRNRLIMGAMRYGPLSENSLKNYDVHSEVYFRVSKYVETENLEFLVDALNFCMLSYMKHYNNRHNYLTRTNWIMALWIMGKNKGHRVTATDDVYHSEEV